MVFYFTATGNSLYAARCLDANPISIPQVKKNFKFKDHTIGIRNIKMQDGRARRLRKTCEFCLACIQNCPNGAIKLKAEKNPKERYRNPNVTLEDLAMANCQTENAGSGEN